MQLSQPIPNALLLLCWLLLQTMSRTAAFAGPRPRLPTRIVTLSMKTAEIPILSYTDTWKVIPDIWETLAKTIPDNPMLVDSVNDPNTASYSFKQMYDTITAGAASFQKLGVLPGDCVSVFSENSYRWLLAEQAVMKSGACNAVRGSSAPVEELQYIYENSRSVGAVVESTALLKSLQAAGGLKNEFGPPKFIIVLFPKESTSAELEAEVGGGVKVLTFDDFTAFSNKGSFNSEFVPRSSDQPATIVYTSGTTSKPKGVVLSHSNMLYQVTHNSFTDHRSESDMKNRGTEKDPAVGDVFLTILPCWHILERTAEYYCLSRGAQLVYTNLKNFKKDLVQKKPHFIIAVPRLFETVQKGVEKTFKEQPASKRKLIAFFTAATQLYKKSLNTLKNLAIRDSRPNILEKLFALVTAVVSWPFFKLADRIVWSKIRENLGGRVKVMVSGGSSIPARIESFYDMIGMTVLNGYGLTETSPVICNRASRNNILGTVGKPPTGTTLKILDPETKVEVPVGKAGVLYAKGPGVMTGYKSNPSATADAIGHDMFFNTGDLARINPSTGDFIITGRAKDTIVLSNGENVEPLSIEEAILSTSPLVDQVMLVGQDEKFLSALTVLSVPELIQGGFISAEKGAELSAMISSGASSSALRKEAEKLWDIPALKDNIMAMLTNVGAKLRPWERIGAVVTILEPFSIQNGLLTQTMKMKRDKVTAAYKSEILNLYTKKSK